MTDPVEVPGAGAEPARLTITFTITGNEPVDFCAALAAVTDRFEGSLGVVALRAGIRWLGHRYGAIDPVSPK